MSLKLHQHLVIVVGLLASSFTFSAVKEYHLNIDEQTVNITGKAVKRITVNGQFPAPNLEFEEGDDAVIHVHNHLKKARYFRALAWVIVARFNGWSTRF